MASRVGGVNYDAKMASLGVKGLRHFSTDAVDFRKAPLCNSAAKQRAFENIDV